MQCMDDCVPDLPGVGGAGAGGSPPGTGGSPPGSGGTPPGTGGSPPGTGGTPPGTGGTPPGTGGTPPGTGGTPPGTGGTPPGTGGSGGSGGTVAGTNWLSFDGDWADPGVAPNGALNISGVIYAYADPCTATYMTWDPTTRCVSGSICAFSSTNWGMAIGFDFRNTGELGVPANTKMPWSAPAVAARGVAWNISGTVPHLQVWVLNMDPTHAGMCMVDDCSISGPPDGTPSPLMNGTLLFNSMVKDDWGGSGTDYVFSPTNISALQFKIPSVEAAGFSYDFCVDQLGIVL